MMLRWLKYSSRVKNKIVHLHTQNVFTKTKNLTDFAVTDTFVSRNGQKILQHNHHKCPVPTSRLLHTSRPRYVNPAIVAILRPLSRIAAILIGRGFRKWWQSLPPEKRTLLMQHLLRNKYRYIGGSIVIGGAGYTYYEDHIVPAPLTGRRRFIVFTAEQLHTIARHTYEEEVREYANFLMPENHPLVNQVRRVGNQLLRANRNIPQLYTKSWTVTVIDNPTNNCYVLPSGDIVMFKGMMDLLENDDQLAAILAHEMSHAILEHSSEKLSYGYLLDVLILLPLAVIWAFIPHDGLALVTQWFLNQVVQVLINLPYSRKLEEEADAVGLQLAAKACYDVREASAFWGKMSLLDLLMEKNNKETSEPAWLSTHPSHSERQEKIDAQMEEAFSIRNFCQCPKLRPEDPRNTIKSLCEQVKSSSSLQESRSL